MCRPPRPAGVKRTVTITVAPRSMAAAFQSMVAPWLSPSRRQSACDEVVDGGAAGGCEASALASPAPIQGGQDQDHQAFPQAGMAPPVSARRSQRQGQGRRASRRSGGEAAGKAANRRAGQVAKRRAVPGQKENGAGVATKPRSSGSGRGLATPVGSQLNLPEQAPSDPIRVQAEQAPTDPFRNPFARRLQSRRTPRKVGSASGFPFASRFFPGCPTSASPVSIPKDLGRLRGGGTRKFSPVARRPLPTAKADNDHRLRFGQAESAWWITGYRG